MDQITGYLALAFSVGAVILGIVNHRRCRSSCFGREGTVSLDIEATTPPIKSEPLITKKDDA